MRNKLIAFVCVLCLSLALTACNNSENNENAQGTGTPTASVTEQPSNTPTEAPTSTPTETPTPEPTETPVENFAIRIIDYLTDSEVIETVYSVDEEGRPLATVTHADGTIQWHTLYEEDGEILWFANVKGENAGQWGGDYKIPNSTEPTETPTPTEAPTPAPTETPAPTPEPVHEHSYTKTIIKEAGCWPYNPGTTRYTCSCGHSYDEETFIEHVRDNVRVVIKEATCTEPENTAEHCIYCGKEIYIEMSASELGHTPNNYWVYHVEQGQYTKSCSRCNYIIERTTVKPEGEEIKEMTGLYFN